MLLTSVSQDALIHILDLDTARAKYMDTGWQIAQIQT